MRTLHQFHGGIHLPGNKAQSTQRGIALAPLPSRLVIPFRQHAGDAARPIVQAGDHVLKGQLIGMPDGFVSSAVHATTSGMITAIDMQPVVHYSGLPDLCATLIPDGEEKWFPHAPVDDYRKSDPAELRRHLRMSGVVGLGGAVFPSDLKLRPLRGHPNKDIGTLVLNGAECEPYITCDDMLMRERATEIVQGAEMLRFMLEAEIVLIGIEDNKPEAIAAMRQAVADSGMRFEVVAVPTIYPGGGAKQLIRVLTGLEVTAGKLPTDIGVQCFNVATCYSVYRAFAHGEPLLSRIVTVTGNVRQPQNFEALIGTPVNELVALSEDLPDTNGYIMGGPMMGVRLSSPAVPLVKSANCIIAASDSLFPPAQPAMPCIRCTRCAQGCPADLQPQELYWFSRAREFGKAQEYNLFECIECGVCSYVCPSHIPLVQYFRFAKSEIRARAQDKQAADHARERYEFREYRIEREKRERAERLAARAKTAQAAGEPPAAIKPVIAVQHAAQQPEDVAEIEVQRARIREIAKSEVELPKEEGTK